jgi:hypothetical protein
VDVRDPASVLKLVKDYFRDPEFFPGASKAVAPKWSPDGPEVKEEATRLYERLAQLLPKGKVVEWAIQPLMRMELRTGKIAKVAGPGAKAADFDETISIREMNPRALQIFGMTKLDTETSFGGIVHHWAQRSIDASRRWMDDLRNQVVRAAHRETPTPQGTQLEAADNSGRYLPVLTAVRQVPALDALQFDLSFIPFDALKILLESGDPYYREYQDTVTRITSSAHSLAPFLTPIATRFLNKWAECVKSLVDSGTRTLGPERLEITRQLVGKTSKYRRVERMTADPEAINSRDWLSFYDDVGKSLTTEKIWVLCVDEADLKSNAKRIEAAWKYFKDRTFQTLYCSPREFELATGETVANAVSGHDVIEDFGEYVKLLKLPMRSYTGDKIPNELPTILRVTESKDCNFFQNMVKCSEVITEDWLRQRLRSSDGHHPGTAGYQGTS